jgi:hypothetical protein
MSKLLKDTGGKKGDETEQISGSDPTVTAFSADISDDGWQSGGDDGLIKCSKHNT